MQINNSDRREARYGMPPADQILFNREFVVGYSYLFRQARWVLQVLDPQKNEEEEYVDRVDCFRSDVRIPEMFRADLHDYEGGEYDRGHLVSSADRRRSRVENSETFLLSNMAPQRKGFNRGIWKELEGAIRTLASQKKTVEVYVISGPLFQIDRNKINFTGDDVIVPHCFFKSVLAETHRGTLSMYSFIIPNRKTNKPLSDFLTKTTEIEFFTGLMLWDRLRGAKAEKLKATKKKSVWKY